MDALGPEEWTAIWLSLRVAFVATLAALPVAVWIAYVLARKSFPGRQVLNGLVHLPLVLPPVVTGYLLLVLFGQQGPVGAFIYQTFGITFAFRWTGAALAAAIMAFPLMVRAIRLGFEAVDPGLEDAAATLGASRWRIWFTVTLPLVVPGVLAGAILGFAKALGEFGATITFVAAIPGQTQTIPTAIYGLLQVPGSEPAVVGLVIVSVVLAMGALLVSEWLARRMAKRLGGK
ncbi:molybdate ABC transporter permease subunit [Roseobacter sp. CCS2]|uniref:molybdate ABC transporter permease subunit n=1 Tax=Roseobacter sp. CCS2 TaxID=391593 RepID=UPI0000F4038B|nr:molybdate ABC transporter permease subunit [Roseobacter sp. CCS2]EBA13254.1 Molybdate ABC transporter, permease protein [Roseobacter sp. CCS2]